MNRKKIECCYCLSQKDLERDHIPPKLLFPEPRPSNLITVPACRKCNASFQMDDDYFQLKLSLRSDVGDNPEARKNWESIFKSLLRPEAAKLKDRFLNSMEHVEVKTPGGIYLGKAWASNVETIRISRTIERIVRGLFFYETGRNLVGHQVRVYGPDNWEDVSPDTINTLQTTILDPLRNTTPRVVGNSIFAYSHQVMKENAFVSCWLLNFYQCVWFLGMTLPGDMLVPMLREKNGPPNLGPEM